MFNVHSHIIRMDNKFNNSYISAKLSDLSAKNYLFGECFISLSYTYMINSSFEICIKV